MLDENTPIGTYLRRVNDLTAGKLASIDAQVDLMGRIADDPRPVLGQLPDSLRDLAQELDFLSARRQAANSRFRRSGTWAALMVVTTWPLTSRLPARRKRRRS